GAGDVGRGGRRLRWCCGCCGWRARVRGQPRPDRAGAPRRRVVDGADARAPARDRFRGVPRPALDVRRRNRARVPRGGDVHVVEGRVMTEFPPGFFERSDEPDDAEFYGFPRYVTHIDDGAIAAVGALYDELEIRGEVLALMSSWISHFTAAPAAL